MTSPSGFLRSGRGPKQVNPKVGQEPVGDYSRPPWVEPRNERVVVQLDGHTIIDTTDTVRVLETSHPPVYYVPIIAFPEGVLIPVVDTSFATLKGGALL